MTRMFEDLVSHLPALLATVAGAKLTGDFAKKIFGPAADAVGDNLASRYKNRGKHTAHVMETAAVLVHNANRQPESISGRILFPLLECASLEDEPELQHRWAALLANASLNLPDNKILPAYIEILRQLTPLHVRILDTAYIQREETQADTLAVSGLSREAAQEHLGISEIDYALVASDLSRLRLVDVNFQVFGLKNERRVYKSQYDTIALTALGLGFLRACKAPALSDS
jgi:hypothetical protein